MSHAKKGKEVLSRREALKALAAATGAVALSSLPRKWETPLIEVGALPVHAQGSAYIYFEIFTEPNGVVGSAVNGVAGPAAMKVTVDPATGIARVEAINRRMDVAPKIDLNIDGTPSNDFSGTKCSEEIPFPQSAWNVENYILGAPTISITSSGPLETKALENGGWTVTLPMGTGSLPDLKCR